MNIAVTTILTLPIVALIAFVIVPNRWANAGVARFRQGIRWITGFQFIVAALAAVAFITGAIPTIDQLLLEWPATPISASIYYDGVSSLMLVLVSFVGWVICSYSIRYLDGDAAQGKYFRWTAFTIGSVSLMVISGNLLMFIACWIMTSLGLHQLLLHYTDRKGAQRAAWTKFAISRIGDLSLLIAAGMIYSQFETLQFSTIFSALSADGFVAAPILSFASLLLVVGAVTKSAQFPFHTWLPQTMETPTPVSALMHAGIVNAGGYLIIRTSPLVSIAPWVLSVLAIIGGATACMAAVIMLTQTSVKKSLAYSTIAQMGFMMLQCGLGAFSAAMLHILAHSLYKAYAFLSSGSVMAHRAATTGAQKANYDVPSMNLAGAALVIIACLGAAFAVFGINPITKPGGLMLGGVLCLALTHWVGQVMRVNNRVLLIRSFAISALLCFAYVASYVAVHEIIAASLPPTLSAATGWLVGSLLLAGFAGMFVLHAQLASEMPPSWLKSWYVHASNGFYFENAFRSLFGGLASS